MKSLKKYIFRIALFVGLFAPNVNTNAFVLQGVMPFVLLLAQKNHIQKPQKWAVCLLVTIALSFILYSFYFGSQPEFKSFATAAQLLSLFLLFPFCRYDASLDNRFLYICGFLLVGSQMAMVFDISIIKSFIDEYYPLDADNIAYQLENVSAAEHLILAANSRYYGIFRNPNAFSTVITILLAAYLIENEKSSIRNKLPFVLLLCFSVFLTGSRTGIVVCFVMLLFDISFDKVKKKLTLSKIVYSLVALSIFLIFSSFFGLNETRTMDISINDASLGGRLEGFVFLWNSSMNLMQWLVGNFSWEILQTHYQYWGMDGDLGSILFLYGIVGLYVISSFLFWMYKQHQYAYYILLILTLWMVTNHLFLGVKNVYLFMLLTSYYYFKKKQYD